VGDSSQLPVDCAECDAQVEADARNALGVGDLPMKIHRVGVRGRARSGSGTRRTATRPRRLGLTSAILDAQDLCWKVTAVLNGYASPALLDTYEAAARSTSATASARLRTLSITSRSEANSASRRKHARVELELLRRVWSDRPEGAELRAAVPRAMRAQSLEFSELNVEYGYSYNSAAVVPDGTPARRCSWTTSASTSRQPVRARCCRTRGSMTGTATAGPSRTSSSPGGSCLSPARLVVVGAAPALTRVS
jgi:hypothetical protein